MSTNDLINSLGQKMVQGSVFREAIKTSEADVADRRETRQRLNLPLWVDVIQRQVQEYVEKDPLARSMGSVPQYFHLKVLGDLIALRPNAIEPCVPDIYLDANAILAVLRKAGHVDAKLVEGHFFMCDCSELEYGCNAKISLWQ